jgi:uncharacterized membrane protein
VAVNALRAANLGLRFLLELALLAAVSYWGRRAQGAALAIVMPVVFAAVWGAFLSPKAKVALPQEARLALELVVFALAAAGLFAAGATALGVAFAAVVVVNETLLSARRRR